MDFGVHVGPATNLPWTQRIVKFWGKSKVTLGFFTARVLAPFNSHVIPDTVTHCTYFE